MTDSDRMPSPGGRREALASIALVALAAGPLTGVLHAAILFVERVLLGHFTWFSREFVWMAPVAYGLLFAVAAIPLVLLALVRPAWVRLPAVAWYYATGLVFGLLLPYSQLGRTSSLLLAMGVATQVARLAGARARGVRTWLPRWALAQAVVLAAVALAQPRWRAWREARLEAALPAAPDGAPSVLLLVLDTVRAASLSLYGYPHPTTPTLERIAREGVAFDWAFATAPWTLPSHASVFTGHWPGEETADWKVPLAPTSPVLAEAFAARGYRTGGFVANLDYTTWDSGLARGFARYEDYGVTWAQLLLSTSYTQTALGERLLRVRSMAGLRRALAVGLDLSINQKHADAPVRADEVTRRFLRWQARNPERPFFAFLNYFDAHQAYYAPPGFPTVGDTSRPGSRYTTAIAWVDRNVDALLVTLAQRGVLDRTVVVILGDHGELFDEHGLSGHAHNMYRNVLHVPLVVRFPGRVPAGVRVGRQVSLRDVAATVAELTGLPPGRFPGTSLRAAWAGGAPSEAVAEVRHSPTSSPTYPTGRGDVTAWVGDSLHYIREAGGAEALYAYRTDTLEARDLRGDSARVAAARGALAAHRAARRAGGR